MIFRPADWAKHEFGDCDLGDSRRTKRLVKISQRMAERPDASTPEQFEEWSELKACYRLIDNKNVQHSDLIAPHINRTCNPEPGDYLILADTTDLNFKSASKAEGLGPLGKTHKGRGFLLHNGLMVRAQDHRVVGLAGQWMHYREPVKKGETRAQRANRYREVEVWGELSKQIGTPPPRTRFINVCDAGADCFDTFLHFADNSQDWVVNMGRLQRKVIANRERMSLAQCAQRAEVAGTYDLTYPTEKGQRTAHMEVRCGKITMPQPRLCSPWVRQHESQAVDMWFVSLEEVQPPKGVKPLRWFLVTSLPVNSFENAWQVIEHYEARFIVEEYHKALKTGCRIGDRQYEKDERLENILGILSIVAVRLLQLRSESRHNPDRSVKGVVPAVWVNMLRSLRKNRPINTVRQFYRQLAGLGGHMLRKSDGDPGWITIWRGFKKLCMAINTMRAYRRTYG